MAKLTGLRRIESIKNQQNENNQETQIETPKTKRLIGLIKTKNPEMECADSSENSIQEIEIPKEPFRLEFRTSNPINDSLDNNDNHVQDDNDIPVIFKDSLPFLEIDGDDSYKILYLEYIYYLEDHGFWKYEVGKDFMFVREVDNKVSIYEIHHIRDFMHSQCSYEEMEFVIKNDSAFFSKSILAALQTLPPFKSMDISNEAYFFFKSYCYVLKPYESPKTIYYNELPEFIWEKQTLKRDIETITDLSELAKGEFYKFIMNVSNNDIERFNGLVSAIGYLLHGYNDPSKTKAIIFMDEQMPMTKEEANGGTGKSIVGKAIRKFKGTTLEVSGRQMMFNGNRFVFQRLDADTQIVFINDADHNFPFSKLFNGITDGFEVEKKQQLPFMVDGIKVLITTNYTMGGIGASFNRRKFEIEFADYYNEFFTPEKEFGHLLFHGWDKNQWNYFDNFMLYCVQYYLENGLVPPKNINAQERRILDGTCQDFLDFIKAGNVIPYQQYINHELFISFVKYCDYSTEVSKKYFTMYLSTLASIWGWRFMRHIGTGNTYAKIWFIENTKEGLKKPVVKIPNPRVGMYSRKGKLDPDSTTQQDDSKSNTDTTNDPESGTMS